VRQVTYANWFGGYYQDPKNFFPNFAVGPGYVESPMLARQRSAKPFTWTFHIFGGTGERQLTPDGAQDVETQPRIARARRVQPCPQADGPTRA